MVFQVQDFEYIFWVQHFEYIFWVQHFEYIFWVQHFEYIFWVQHFEYIFLVQHFEYIFWVQNFEYIFNSCFPSNCVSSVKHTSYEGRSIIYLPEKERNNLSQKKIFFIFQCSPPITQYTSPTFVATTLSPWKKNLLTALQTRPWSPPWLLHRLKIVYPEEIFS